MGYTITARDGDCEVCGLKDVHLVRGSVAGQRGIKWQCGECTRCNNLWRRYGLSKEQHRELLERQGFKCAICGQPECEGVVKMKDKVKRLCVDHCHSTNAVRGLLCNSCNTVVGMCKENTDFLRKAIEYIETTQVVVTSK